MSAPDNPPAFPIAYETLGMSLRDWFAGHALPTVIAAMQSGTISDHPTACGGPTGFAATAYDIADAMLAEREARDPASIPAPPYTEGAADFNIDLEAAPRDGSNLMARLADGTEHPMCWWRNWPGWRAASLTGVMGEPIEPLAWRPLTNAEALDIEIPF